MPFPYALPWPGDDVGVYDAAAYGRMLKQLLPRGVLWDLESDSEITAALLAFGTELARVDARGADLVEESDPRTAAGTLAEWERMLGLPDEQVTEIPATTAGRRLAITQKLIARAGQNDAFFEALALACGYTATFSNYNAVLSRSGRMRCGQRLRGMVSAYTMKVTVSAIAATALSQDDFERVIRHATHSHITVYFEYP
jgi:uncharacterized protein YmfQ (DUF2313 family)